MDFDTNLSISDDTLTLVVKYQRKPELLFNVCTPFINCFGVSSMSIAAGSSVAIVLDPRDQYGNKASVDGTPVWNLVGEEMGRLEVAPSGVQAIFNSTGKAGIVKVEVAADVDLSSGIRNLGGFVDIEIVAGEAVDLGAHLEPLVISAAPITVAEAAAIAEAGAASPDVVVVEEQAPVEVAPVEEVAEQAAEEQASAVEQPSEEQAATESPVEQPAEEQASAVEQPSEEQPSVEGDVATEEKPAE